MYEKLYIGTAFDKFRGKLKGYAKRKFENVKDAICVVTDMEDPMIFFEENNMPEDLDEK